VLPAVPTAPIFLRASVHDEHLCEEEKMKSNAQSSMYGISIILCDNILKYATQDMDEYSTNEVDWNSLVCCSSSTYFDKIIITHPGSTPKNYQCTEAMCIKTMSYYYDPALKGKDSFAASYW
jgi:hypothetical protein